MRISGCRLKEKTQDRLAEFFVGGVTARSAADLARVNRKTAAYFLALIALSVDLVRVGRIEGAIR